MHFPFETYKHRVKVCVCIYIYIQTFTWCLYVSNGKCILYEFYVSLNVYLQWTMFDFNFMNGKYANLVCN